MGVREISPVALPTFSLCLTLCSIRGNDIPSTISSYTHTRKAWHFRPFSGISAHAKQETQRPVWLSPGLRFNFPMSNIVSPISF